MVVTPYLRVAKHAACGESDALLEALAALDGDPEEVAEALRRHHLIPLIRMCVPEGALRAGPSAERLAAVESRSRSARVPLETLLRCFGEVRAAFEAAGVPLLLLKGFTFADRLYGGLARRPQFDIDVLVRRRDLRRALRLLVRLGFARKGRDLHSRTLARGDVKIDVHHCLRWAPAFALDEAAYWSTAREVSIEGLRLRTLSDEYTLVFLVLACFEDLGQGMGKLKQLLDLYLFLREIDAQTDWDAFLARREGENLLAITVNVLSLVTDVFDARHELPRLSAALEPRRALCVLRSREELLRLLDAPRKDAASLAWFGRVYPGSMLHYLAWFWYGGLPANLRQLGPAWLRSNLRLALDRSRERRRTSSVSCEPQAGRNH